MTDVLAPTVPSPSSPARSRIEVSESGRGDQRAWDDYVAAHPRATFFHQHGWREVLEVLGHRPLLLRATRRGEIRGVLPLVLARDHRGARMAVSLPHTVYGGPLAADDDSERALYEAALRVASAGGARRLELRNRHLTGLDLPLHEGYVTFERELPAGRALLASFSKGARAAVGQAERSGLRATLDGDLDTFYALFAASYRQLGTPVYPKRFLAAIRDRFRDRVSILIARHGDRPVAGAFALRFRDTMMPPLFSGELPVARRLRANNFKFFHLMEQAMAQGLHRFDFGRSRLTHPGVVAFKRHLGFEPIPLPYQAWPESPGAGADPNTGGWLALRTLWRRLPAAVADRLGPLLVRRFP